MEIDQLKKYNLPEFVLKKLKEQGIQKLNPPQQLAVQKGLFEGKNLVVASPTASGKTLIAMLAMANVLEDKKGKALYMVPLRALAQEKYEEFKNFFDGSFKVAISTGDYDSSDSWLAEYDIIVLTVEKTDSLLRHDAQWINNTKIVVADEIHLLNDLSRGATLEVVLTRLRQQQPQILALSATVKNVKEVAGWLGAKPIVSDYRPVKLYEGVYDGEKIKFLQKEPLHISGASKDEIKIIEETVKLGKQALVFAGTRRNAEAIAEKASALIKNYLQQDKKQELQKMAEAVEKTLEYPTKQCKRLGQCIAGGVAFHHAGLANKQRKLIESAFKQNIIKIIVATPTLAAGVNLPAFRVLIRDTKRYYSGYGSAYIPVLEYQQMAGRAGRPAYDSEGESILIAKNEKEAEELFNRYVCGEPEEIYSKLAVEPLLRMHVLSFVAAANTSEEELYKFFSKTFYAYQFGDLSQIKEIIRRVLDELIEWKFVIQLGTELRTSRIGKRISELYLDPETAHNLIKSLESFSVTNFGLLYLISSAREIAPLLTVRNSEYKEMQDLFAKKESDLMIAAERHDFYLDDNLDIFKSALLLETWCNEQGEDFIYEKFNVAPGELHARREIADWLLYACGELTLLLGRKESLLPIRKLRVRMKYGVREELLPLVRLRGIGRVRARLLWRSNIRAVADIRGVPLKRLAEILGEKLAKELKEQLGIES